MSWKDDDDTWYPEDKQKIKDDHMWYATVKKEITEMLKNSPHKLPKKLIESGSINFRIFLPCGEGTRHPVSSMRIMLQGKMFLKEMEDGIFYEFTRDGYKKTTHKYGCIDGYYEHTYLNLDSINLLPWEKQKEFYNR